MACTLCAWGTIITLLVKLTSGYHMWGPSLTLRQMLKTALKYYLGAAYTTSALSWGLARVTSRQALVDYYHEHPGCSPVDETPLMVAEMIVIYGLQVPLMAPVLWATYPYYLWNYKVRDTLTEMVIDLEYRNRLMLLTGQVWNMQNQNMSVMQDRSRRDN